MNDRDRLDLMLAYAAGALEGPEEQAVRARLAEGDPRLAAALAEADEILARLSATVEPVAPPASLKSSVLSSLPDRRQHFSSPRMTGAASPAPARAAWPPLRLAVAAAVAAILIGGGLMYVALQERSTQVARLQAKLAERERQLGETQDVFGSADTKLTVLKPTDAGTQEYGRVIVDPTRRQVKVYIYSLVPPPPGKTYQLWLMPEGGGNPVPAPVFMVDATGRAVITADIPSNVKAVAGAAVSVEPPQGSASPSNVKLLSKAI
ncbi:anti-sigma factor [Humisphaera borealis]|uniref:Regulator of SigK n=1 Tax=Humisphaera borealis TaxID=2807512 RepID=A0A7M2WSF9_9BACT|nr:anti-sigma factor [Humisphaera borealis]QOV88465.1 anti-sigma factor [Humisphaera borealis]